MNKTEKKMRNLPIVLVLLYISGTFLMSVCGPMKYIGYKWWNAACFLALVLLMFGIGFRGAQNVRLVWRKTRPYQTVREYSDRKLILFVKAAILIAVFVCILEFISLYQMNPALLRLSNIGSNYAQSRAALDDSYTLAILLRFSTAFFRNVALILGLYYFNSFKLPYKFVYILFLGLLVFNNVVGYGTQKMLGDIAVYAVVIAGVKMLDKSQRFRRRIMMMCIMGLLIVVILFTIMQSERAASIGLTAANFASRSDGLAYYDTDNVIFKILGNELGFGLAALVSSYLSSGYYGLSLCLQLPFVWCFGVGNSYALSVFANRFLGWENMYYNTYLYRMEETFGRNGLRSWNTIFPWLASDLTFGGVILLFLLLGYIWCVAWDEILKYRNPVSLLLFANMSLGLVFIPANNQLLSSIDACMTTPFVILAWILFHKKFNVTVKK